MNKEDFINLLKRNSPNEILEFIKKKGKKKILDVFIFFDDK